MNRVGVNATMFFNRGLSRVEYGFFLPRIDADLHGLKRIAWAKCK